MKANVEQVMRANRWRAGTASAESTNETTMKPGEQEREIPSPPSGERAGVRGQRRQLGKHRTRTGATSGHAACPTIL